MATTDAEEFAWWQAFDRVEPFGRGVETLAVGLSVLANAIYASRGVRGRFEPADFMPPGTLKPEHENDEGALVEAGMESLARAEEATRGRRR